MTDERIEEFINEGGIRLFDRLEEIATAISEKNESCDRISDVLDGMNQRLDRIADVLEDINGTLISMSGDIEARGDCVGVIPARYTQGIDITSCGSAGA